VLQFCQQIAKCVRLMTKVKICGITNASDASAAAAYGASALGFIFYKQSPRCVTVEDACEILMGVSPFIKKVGVFVNEDRNIVNEIANKASLDLIQLSGDESPVYCKGLNRPYIKAVRVKNKESLNEINEYDTQYTLFDTYSKSNFGGTGKVFNWDLIQNMPFEKRYIILSGGLNSENVKNAIKQVNPYAVDIATGVEKLPGKKDHEKMKNFIEAVRNAI